jgi:hypothetical protein
MEANGQLHAPAALPPWKDPPVPNGWGWVGPKAVLDAVIKRKIPSPRRESNPKTPTVQPVVSRYTDWAITTLYWKKASGQLQVPAALPPGKKPPVPTGFQAGWAPEPVWTRGRENKIPFPAPATIQTPGVQPVAYSIHWMNYPPQEK